MSTREQASIIDAAVAAGVKRFIPSEYGNDTFIPEVATLVPPAQGKQETIKYLRTKESSGLSWTAICVGAFFDWTFQRPGLLGWNLPTRKAVIFDGGNDEFEATNLEQIGRAIAAVLMPENPEDTKTKNIYVNSFTVTQNRILGILKRLTGNHFAIEHAKKAELSKRGLGPQNFAGRRVRMFMLRSHLVLSLLRFMAMEDSTISRRHWDCGTGNWVCLGRTLMVAWSRFCESLVGNKYFGCVRSGLL
jgi:hypothetical protein